MHVHPNARTTPQLRLQLVTRVAEGEPVEEVARAVGLSRATVYKWIARYRSEGPSGLLDRSSAPKRRPTKTSSKRTKRILKWRRQRWLMRDQEKQSSAHEKPRLQVVATCVKVCVREPARRSRAAS
jgi:transposase